MKKNHQLAVERSRVSLLVAVLMLAAISGLGTWLVPGMATWEQWTFLLHTLAGIFLTLILFPYIWIHFVRTLGLRRPALAATGLLALSVSLVLSGSGVWITLFGQREAERSILSWHIWSGVLVFVVLLAHLAAHRLLLPASRRHDNEKFPSITAHAARLSKRFAISGAVIVIALTTISLLVPQPYRDEAVIQPYTLEYGENPFAPSLVKTPTGSFLDPARLDDSADCGECHTDILEQWQSSMHGKAGSDKSYQTNIQRLADRDGIEAIRYCDGCHTPPALVGGVLSEGGSLTSRWHMEEGISCRSCHSIDAVMHTRGVASYSLNPHEPYLFGGYRNRAAEWLRDNAIKLNPEAHRESLKNPLLSEARFCATCHVQFMDESMNQWGWVKMQDEYLAWLNSPYSGHSDKPFANQEARNCRDCHMPLIPANDPSADDQGRVRSHHFAAANMTIPFFDGDLAQMERSRDFLQSDRLRVSIIRPDREHSTVSEFRLSPDARREDEAPAHYYVGEQAELNVVVHNIGVGHDFPGGTIDINEAWLAFEVVDATDRVVFASGEIGKDGHVDKDAYFYRSLPVDKQGNHVWNHELFNMIGDSYVNVIPAGAADLTSYTFAIPNWAKSPLTVRCTLRYRKFNQRYAEWSLQSPGIEVPVADVAFDAMTLPIRERPEAFTNELKEAAIPRETARPAESRVQGGEW